MVRCVGRGQGPGQSPWAQHKYILSDTTCGVSRPYYLTSYTILSAGHYLLFLLKFIVITGLSWPLYPEFRESFCLKLIRIPNQHTWGRGLGEVEHSIMKESHPIVCPSSFPGVLEGGRSESGCV